MSSWRSLLPTPPSPDQFPRRLTEEEIASILDELPSVRAGTVEAAHQADLNIRKRMDAFLGKMELTPLAIPEFIQEMKRKFEISRATPGTTAGLEAANAIGRSSMQTTLNSFHVSGSSKNVSGGLEGMKEAINVSKTRKYESCTVHFKDKYISYIQILRKRRQFVGITVGALVKDYTIDTIGNLPSYWWQKSYSTLRGKTFNDDQYVLRLFLDKDVMYQHYVTMESITKVIEVYHSPSLVCVHSPTSEGIIDIIPDERLIKSSLEERKLKGIITDASLVFLEAIVKPTLDKLLIHGIPGIKNVFPAHYNVISIISREIKMSEKMPAYADQYPRAWYLLPNEFVIRTTGITMKRLIDLMVSVGFEILQEQSNYVLVNCPTDDSPRTYIEKIVSEKEKQDYERLFELRKKGIFEVPLTDPLISAARLFYLETDGSNLREILLRGDVDPKYTYCNNYHEMASVFGMCAARSFYVKDLDNIIKGTEQYVNTSFIELIGNFVTNQGRLLGITFTGISRQPISFLGLASFQKANLTFAKAAMFGKSEDPGLDISAAIYTGRRISSGTGMPTLNIKPEYLKMAAEAKKNGTKMGAAELEDAIFNYDNILSGSERIQNVEVDDNGRAVVDLPEQMVVPAVRTTESKETSLGIRVAPMISQELMDVLHLLTRIPGTPSSVTIEPLRHGLLASPSGSPGGSPARALVQLPAFTFVESTVKQKIVEQRVRLLDIEMECSMECL